MHALAPLCTPQEAGARIHDFAFRLAAGERQRDALVSECRGLRQLLSGAETEVAQTAHAAVAASVSSEALGGAGGVASPAVRSQLPSPSRWGDRALPARAAPSTALRSDSDVVAAGEAVAVRARGPTLADAAVRRRRRRSTDGAGESDADRSVMSTASWEAPLAPDAVEAALADHWRAGAVVGGVPARDGGGASARAPTLARR